MYMKNLEQDCPDSLKLESICKSPLGFHMYFDFVQQQGEYFLSDFLLHVAHYRTLSPSFRLSYALKIMEAFLMPGNHPSTVQQMIVPRDPGLCRQLLRNAAIQKFESDNPLKYISYDCKLSQRRGFQSEPDTARTQPPSEVSVDQLNTWDLSKQSNVLCIDEGCEPLRETILIIHRSSVSQQVVDNCSLHDDRFDEGFLPIPHEVRVSKKRGTRLSNTSRFSQEGIMISSSAPYLSHRSSSKVSASQDDLSADEEKRGLSMEAQFSAASDHMHSYYENVATSRVDSAQTYESRGSFDAIPIDLFDKLDVIVWTALQEKYENIFQQSVHWINYFKFKAFSERRCDEKDFVLFRKLGKGIKQRILQKLMFFFSYAHFAHTSSCKHYIIKYLRNLSS